MAEGGRTRIEKVLECYAQQHYNGAFAFSNLEYKEPETAGFID